jgi:exodeoxyribonuclease V alpha subunit
MRAALPDARAACSPKVAAVWQRPSGRPRRAASSPAPITSTRVSSPDLSQRSTDSDFYFVQTDDPETAVARIIELVKTRIPKRFGVDPIRDIQVLCPMNRGGVGARSLNIELQTALNPASDHKVERFGWTFAPDDKVMQIENDYDKDVYNGDIGNVECINPADGELVANFDGRAVTYGFGEPDMLVPAYAATIHKSQGSEYPVVVIPIMTQHYAMLQRNLLYTGVTWGKKLVVLVGQKKAVAIAVRMSRADDGGRSCRNASAPTYLYHGRSVWRAEPWALNISSPHRFGIS